MDPSIKGALIGAIASLIVCLVNNAFQQSAIAKQNNATIMLINYQIEELKKEVSKHNSIIDRLYKVEEKITLHGAEIDCINARINDDGK